MGILVVGLNFQCYGVYRDAPSYLEMACYLYLAGGLLLIFPPYIEYCTTQDREQLEFSKLLIVLESFLLISAVLFFWKSNFPAKVAVRIGASLLVTAYLKYGLKQLPDFRWKFLFNPIEFIRYHIDCFRGKYGPAYLLGLGIDWLGVGYAFLEYPFGQIAMMIGSAYLLVSSWRGYKTTKAPLPVAWAILNFLYLVYGVFFLMHSLA